MSALRARLVRPCAVPTCKSGNLDEVDFVRAWRTPDDDRLLWMQGVTTRYRVDPVGEYVIGVVCRRSYHLTRGRSKLVVRPHQLVVLDPSVSHSGSPAEQGPWSGRLLVVELPDVSNAAFDVDDARVDLDFPDPIVGDPRLASRFLALHQSMEDSASTLERQSEVVSFLQDVRASSPSGEHPTRVVRDDPAVQRACECLRADITRNVSLEELSAVAGTTKYRLVRLFKATFGVPPHAFQVSQRVMRARRLIERGMPTAQVAVIAGFVDQSHLHRHFTRRLGMTPREYANALA
jgi:AraC-like DNA-binding protein